MNPIVNTSLELPHLWQRYRFVISAAKANYWRSLSFAIRQSWQRTSRGLLCMLEGVICMVVLLILSMPLLFWRCALQPIWLAVWRGEKVAEVMRGGIILALFSLASCAHQPMTAKEQQGLADAEGVAISGLVGYATGGTAGAIVGASGAALRNIQRNQLAAAKNPARVKNPLDSPVIPR